MAVNASPDEPASQRYREDLEGLDPHDPEVREFAAHLDRMQTSRSGFTVEGYIGGVSDFADSANRLGGHYRMLALLVIGLILLGVGVAVWDSLVFILSSFGG